HARVAAVYHRRGNPQVVLQELVTHPKVFGIAHCQLDGDSQHVLRKKSHPGGAVGLFQIAPSRQRGAAIEDADVVQSEEPSLEDVPAGAVFRLTHQVKLSSSFWKMLLSHTRSPSPLWASSRR